MPNPRHTKALEEIIDEISHVEIAPEECTILVIDDEASIVAMLTEFLSKEGYPVIGASNAQQGLSLLESENPAIVLCDKNLPDIDGLEVIRTGKQRFPETEFIVVTGYASIDSAIEALDLGAHSYIAKPFGDLEKVKVRIRSAVSKRTAIHHNALLIERLRSAYDTIFNAFDELDTLNVTLEEKVKERTQSLTDVIQDVMNPLASVERDVEKLYDFVSSLEATGAGGHTGRAKMVLNVVKDVRRRSDELLQQLDSSDE